MNLTSHKNWKTVKLGDIAVFNYGKSLVSTSRVEGDFPVYGSSGITGYHNEALVSEKGYIIGRKGSVGTIYFSDKPFWPIDTVYYVVEKDLKCDFDFFFYLLKTLGLDKLNFDSAVPGLNRDMSYSLGIQIPESLDEQKEIAEILGSLDNKIELLRAQNKTLESIAQAMFKEWFVEFRFPGYEKVKMVDGVPEGWKIGSLTDIADFLNGVASQKFPAEDKNNSLPVIKIKEMKAGITSETDRASKNVGDEYIVKSGDLLFSWSGSLDVIFWNDIDGMLNQHLFKVTSENYPKWFYYYWTLYHLPEFRSIAQSKATTMGHIQRHHLDDARVLIPAEDALNTLDKVISPILNKQIKNNSEIRSLIQLRDSLLNQIFSN